MSLSQKFSGLILAPWFNSDEWHYVYRLIYSSKEEQQKALDILKVWKLRTPILSAGVEGTLILLEALLLDSRGEQVSSVYAIALMRFLNLSAANSEKQGSFGKTSARNELPKWLINLRHDIAHGHQLPSLYNLKLGLEFGLDWLKTKYWEPQSFLVRDYYLSEESVACQQVSAYLESYIRLSLDIYENKEVKSFENLPEEICQLFSSGYTDVSSLREALLEKIHGCLNQSSSCAQVCVPYLVCPGVLLRPCFDVDITGILKPFCELWADLLNTFHLHGKLFVILEELSKVLEDVFQTDNTKIMAALWIREIFTSLINMSTDKESTLTLNTNEHNYKKESLDFQKLVLKLPPIGYHKYFLQSILDYNSTNETVNQDVLLIVTKAATGNLQHSSSDRIYTLDDLHVDVEFEAQEEEQCLINSEPVKASEKWKKVEDASMFLNCPIGVLPHQRCQKHFFLVN